MILVFLHADSHCHGSVLLSELYLQVKVYVVRGGSNRNWYLNIVHVCVGKGSSSWFAMK